MLVLTGKIGEKIHIGNDILLVVVDIRHGQVRLGIEAPKEVRIVRHELLEREAEEWKPRT